jgi:hypothetical protein
VIGYASAAIQRRGAIRKLKPDEHRWTRIQAKRCPIRVNPCPSVVKESSQPAAISGDTDRLQVCATDGKHPKHIPSPAAGDARPLDGVEEVHELLTLRRAQAQKALP